MPLLSSFEHTDPASELKFVARAIRRDKGQTRADVSILKPPYKTGSELDRDEFRFSDRTKRNALANSAFTALKREIPLPGQKEEMQLLLRMFLDMVESEHSTSITIAPLAGLSERVEQPWLVYGYLTEGAGTFLVGPPGVGKSWTGLLLAQSVGYDIRTVFPVMKLARVLYVNLERSAASLQNRLGMVNRVLGLPPETELDMLNARGRSMTEVHEAIDRYIHKHDIGLVIVDSLSRMGMGSMVEDNTASQMMDTLNSYEIGWLALGHTPRADATHVFGSQMLTAAADFEIVLKAKEEPGHTFIGFDVKKTNDAPKVSLAAWKYDFDRYGLEHVSVMTNPSTDLFKEEK